MYHRHASFSQTYLFNPRWHKTETNFPPKPTQETAWDIPQQIPEHPWEWLVKWLYISCEKLTQKYALWTMIQNQCIVLLQLNSVMDINSTISHHTQPAANAFKMWQTPWLHTGIEDTMARNVTDIYHRHFPWTASFARRLQCVIFNVCHVACNTHA